MIMRAILHRETWQLIGQAALIIILGWFRSYGIADDTVFKDKGVQPSTLTDEYKKTGINRFPTDSNRSAIGKQQGEVLSPKIGHTTNIRETGAALKKNRTS